MALIIDIETTGLPCRTGLTWGKNPSYTDNDKYKTCRMVQFSYMLCNEQLDEIESKNFIIKVDFKIPNSNFHGITDEISKNQGIDINIFLDDFNKTLKKSSHIISHNINFDINVLKNELYRNNKNNTIIEIDNKKLVCSMIEMRKIMNMNKYPSLAELYKFATKNDITKQHNSEYDVMHLHQALKTLYSNNIFKIHNIKCNKIEEIKDFNTKNDNDFNKLKVIELKSKCKEYGLSGYSKCTKNQLIELLTNIKITN